MTTLDDEVLRDLLHRATSDVHARPGVAAAIVTAERRRHRHNRLAGMAITGVAATAVVAVAANAEVGSTPRRTESATATTGPPLQLTSAQRSLYRLGAVAAAAPQPQGRYAVLTEQQGGYAKTSVLDSQTGDVWTYQHGAGVPGELPEAVHLSPTEAQLAAMPTDPGALRAALLVQADQQQAQDQAAMAKLRQKAGLPPVVAATTGHPEGWSDDDMVFQQATGLLWNPLVSPALRAALFQVLATTPGVEVDDHATDSTGRSAIAVSRVEGAGAPPVRTAGGPDGAEETMVTYEDPATSAVLEQDFGYLGNPPTPGDVYQVTTWTDTFPADPYQG